MRLKCCIGETCPRSEARPPYTSKTASRYGTVHIARQCLHRVLARDLGRGDCLFHILHRVSGEILADLSDQGRLQLGVVLRPNGPKGARGGDDQQVGNMSFQNLSVEQGDNAG